MNFDIALREKEATRGLNRNDIIELYDLLNSYGVFPVEFEDVEHETSAIGFISSKAEKWLDFDYERKLGLHQYVASILDDMRLRPENCIYEYKGLKIWLGR